MTFKNNLRSLEKKHLLSRSPHPAIPFLLAIVFFLLAQVPSPFSSTTLILAIISLIFALIHFIIVKTLQKQ